MNPETQITVLSVDDHDLVRKGVAAILAMEPEIRLIGEASTGHEACRMFTTYRPDVTLMDLRLPDMSGIDVTRAIRRNFPAAKIIA